MEANSLLAPHEALPPDSLERPSSLSPQPSSNGSLEPATEPLSKSARKKAAKMARYAAQKLERRAREKEAKKEKKRTRAEKRAAGELDPEQEERDQRKKRVRLSKDIQPWQGGVVVDLGFDDMMTDKEVTSLCSQLSYTYSANRRTLNPIECVLFTSVDKRLRTKLEGMNNAGYLRWARTEWWDEGYSKLWLEGEPVAEGSADDNGESQPSRRAAKESVVYLSADAEDELSQLKENETYIIGGIVDHNRYKNLCLEKAQKDGIRAAKLPIGRFLASMPTRKVLTVNQVFEIMLRWIETRDWEEALAAVIPKRKFNVDGRAARRGNAVGSGEGVFLSMNEQEKDAELPEEGDMGQNGSAEAVENSLAEAEVAEGHFSLKSADAR